VRVVRLASAALAVAATSALMFVGTASADPTCLPGVGVLCSDHGDHHHSGGGIICPLVGDGVIGESIVGCPPLPRPHPHPHPGFPPSDGFPYSGDGGYYPEPPVVVGVPGPSCGCDSPPVAQQVPVEVPAPIYAPAPSEAPAAPPTVYAPAPAPVQQAPVYTSPAPVIVPNTSSGVDTGDGSLA
jgi:hypothetical protein